MAAIVRPPPGGAGRNPPEWTWLMNSPGDTTSAERAARSTGGGNLVNEIADVSFDFVARQVVA
jgi:hypothetical protein